MDDIATRAAARIGEDTALNARMRQAQPIPLNITLHCAAGELLALVGPSGSGKSTILRAIAGLVRPHEGRIACAGAVWLDTDRGVHLPPHRRPVGIVFQSYALFPHMTALENVASALPPGTEGRSERMHEATRLLARVHLEGLEARRPSELSGGQQQRVALARALARRPAILLLDEPFSAVDEATRKRLQSELLSLRRDLSIPILLVTHSLEEASLLGDRLCLVHRGRGLQTGAPADVIGRPRTAQVARLVGHTNLFEGQIESVGAAGRPTILRWAGHRLEVAHRPDHAAHPPGARIRWLIPPDRILLHQRVRPSRGEKENPVEAEIESLLAIGALVRVTLRVAGEANPLALHLPAHVVERNSLRVADRIGVSLLARAIHLMPA